MCFLTFSRKRQTPWSPNQGLRGEVNFCSGWSVLLPRGAFWQRHQLHFVQGFCVCCLDYIYWSHFPPGEEKLLFMPTDQTTGPCFLDSDPLAGLLLIFWLSCAWMFWTITLLQAKEPCYSTLRVLPWVPTHSHVLAPRMQHFLWVFTPAQTETQQMKTLLWQFRQYEF